MAALLGLGGAFLGAYYGATAQVDLWRKEKIYTMTKDTLDKRVEIMKSIIRLNIEADRVGAIATVIRGTAAAWEAVIRECKQDASKPVCKEGLKSPFDEFAALKEMADLRAQYSGSLTIATVYFCDKTRAAIAELMEIHKNWWEIDPSIRDRVVSAMGSELSCGSNFKALLE